jgi:molybdopterin synthase catalytic subunit
MALIACSLNAVVCPSRAHRPVALHGAGNHVAHRLGRVKLGEQDVVVLAGPSDEGD